MRRGFQASADTKVGRTRDGEAVSGSPDSDRGVARSQVYGAGLWRPGIPRARVRGMPKTLHAPWASHTKRPDDRVVALAPDRYSLPAAETLRVLIAAGHGLVRAGFRVLLE